MPNTEEQRLDIVDCCTQLLEGVLAPFEQVDGTPEGRMITQLKWLKEQAQAGELPLPVAKGKLSTLLYVYTNGELFSADTPRGEVYAIEQIMHKLISLSNEAKLLFKPAYYPFAQHYLLVLIQLLQSPPRKLDTYEQGALRELQALQNLLAHNQIEPPFMNYLPTYQNLRKVFRINRSSIDDLPDGKRLIKLVTNLIFEGIRPDHWLSPLDAQHEIEAEMQ